jgi:hypothetical protein
MASLYVFVLCMSFSSNKSNSNNMFLVQSIHLKTGKFICQKNQLMKCTTQLYYLFTYPNTNFLVYFRENLSSALNNAAELCATAVVPLNEYGREASEFFTGCAFLLTVCSHYSCTNFFILF